MQTIHEIKSLKAALKLLRAKGETTALVPTMGALHAGHLALVELARQHAHRVVVSVFVNPKQFGPNEDFAAYPRTLEADAEKLVAADVDLLWAPSPATMYPQGFATNVSVAELGDGLCGAARPGHFDGVATVVTKLFTQIQPDVAIFGEKDWQQLAIIRRFTTDLDLGVEIIGAPIVREADGLALSSRNIYLSADERLAAAALPRALAEAGAQIAGGVSVLKALTQARQTILSAGFSNLDYLELCDPDTLQYLSEYQGKGRLIAAARIGATRLIDNIPVSPLKNT